MPDEVVLLGDRDTRPFHWDCVKNGHVYIGTDPCAHCVHPFPDDPATGASLPPHLRTTAPKRTFQP